MLEPIKDSIYTKKYIPIKNFFSKDELSILQPYCLNKTFEAAHFDGQSPHNPSYYNDPIMDILLQKKLEKAKEVSKVDLVKTYAYWRGYVHGATLKDHTDRPSCEVSITANIDSCGEKWPIHVNNNWLDIEVGDAVMYLGFEALHGRKPFKGKYCAQVFFHYVNSKGPFKVFENDQLLKIYGE